MSSRRFGRSYAQPLRSTEATRWWRFSASAMDAPFVPVARVVKSHGLHGEVAVKSLVDLPLYSLEGLTVYVVPPTAGVREATLEGVRPGPKGPLLELAGVTDIAGARALCGTTLLVRQEDLPDGYDEAEFDPIGLEVIDGVRGSLGTHFGRDLHRGQRRVGSWMGPSGRFCCLSRRRRALDR